MMMMKGRMKFTIDDNAKDGGKELSTMMYCVLMTNPQ